MRHIQPTGSLPSDLLLLAGIEPCNRERVLDCLHAACIGYDDGDVILEPSSPTPCVACLVAGRADGCIYDEDGNRSILHLFTPGQVLSYGGAFGFGSLLDLTVVARRGCTLLTLDLTAAPSSCESMRNCVDTVRANLAQAVASFDADLVATLGIRTRRTARGKVLAYLEREARRQGSLSVDVPLSRQELADYLAIDRATLSRELRALADEGQFEVKRNHFDLHIKPPKGHHRGEDR